MWLICNLCSFCFYAQFTKRSKEIFRIFTFSTCRSILRVQLQMIQQASVIWCTFIGTVQYYSTTVISKLLFGNILYCGSFGLNEICHHWLTLVPNLCNFFLLWNIMEDILNNIFYIQWKSMGFKFKSKIWSTWTIGHWMDSFHCLLCSTEKWRSYKIGTTIREHKWWQDIFFVGKLSL